MKKISDLPFFSTPKPRIFGHRGASAKAPENTLVSFEKALEDGAHGVEFDVWLSKEGEVVILHDPTLRRTTNGRRRVTQLDVTDLKRFDAGYRFTTDRGVTYPFRGKNIEIPTLAEFFLAFPQARAIIEIKQCKAGVASKVIQTALRYHKEDHVFLATEHDLVMNEIRTALSSHDAVIATGFSYGEVAQFLRWTAERTTAFTPAGQALAIPRGYRGTALVTPKSLEAAHELGIEMWVWTINDSDEMEELLRLGVDGLLTDHPGRLYHLTQTEAGLRH